MLCCASQHEKALSTLQKLSCDTCSPDIERYYDASYDIVEFNRDLIAKASQNTQGSKLFGTGRVVVLRDGVRYPRIAKTTHLTPY